MVRSEGPNSGVCGKAGTEAKAYPTRTVKGLVFVWIGEGPPAPIEQDVPEEFFDEETLILIGQVDWRGHWGGAPPEPKGPPRNHVDPHGGGGPPAGRLPPGAR